MRCGFRRGEKRKFIQLTEAKKSLVSAQTDKDKLFFGRYCESLDGQIDDDVYELYGLKEEELKIVEGK